MKRREFLSKLMRCGLSAAAMNALPVERLFAQELLPTLAIPIIDAHAHLPSDVSSEGHTFMAIRSAKLSATSIAVMGDKDSVVGADLAFTYALEGWENISDIGLLTDAMRAGGLGTLEISAFMGLNLLRVFTRCHAARPILNYFY